MNFIAAVDKNWAIGNKGKLLARIAADQKYFKDTTMGNIVVLGRKTLEEFPASKPLEGRDNIILSRNKDYIVESAKVVHSYEELFDYIKEEKTKEVFVIGGESVYKDLIPYCDKAYITKIDKEYEADAFIENLDQLSQWKVISEKSKMVTKKGTEFQFLVYENSEKKEIW